MKKFFPRNFLIHIKKSVFLEGPYYFVSVIIGILILVGFFLFHAQYIKAQLEVCATSINEPEGTWTCPSGYTQTICSQITCSDTTENYAGSCCISIEEEETTVKPPPSCNLSLNSIPLTEGEPLSLKLTVEEGYWEGVRISKKVSIESVTLITEKSAPINTVDYPTTLTITGLTAETGTYIAEVYKRDPITFEELTTNCSTEVVVKPAPQPSFSECKCKQSEAWDKAKKELDKMVANADAESKGNIFDIAACQIYGTSEVTCKEGNYNVIPAPPQLKPGCPGGDCFCVVSSTTAAAESNPAIPFSLSTLFSKLKAALAGIGQFAVISGEKPCPDKFKTDLVKEASGSWETPKPFLYLDPDYIKRSNTANNSKNQNSPFYRGGVTLWDSPAFSLFDDLICTVTISKTLYDNLKPKPKFTLLSFDKFGNEIEIDSYTVPSLLPGEISKEKVVYKVGFLGWPDGLGSDETLKKIVASNKPKIFCRVTLNSKDYDSDYNAVFPIIRIWGQGSEWDWYYEPAVGGKGRFPIITSQTSSLNKPLKWLIERALDNAKNGFNKIDPFSTYINDFPQYVDLRLNEKEPGERGAEGITPPTWERKDVKTEIIYRKNIESWNGYTDFGSGKIYLGKDIPAWGVIHEFVHSFCLLQDEYWGLQQKTEERNALFKQLLAGGSVGALSNCQYCPLISFLPYGKPYPGCAYLDENSFVYRTSKTSLMMGKKSKDQRLNLWSGAICEARMVGDQINLSTIQYYADWALGRGMDYIYESPSDYDLKIKERCPAEEKSKDECIRKEDCVNAKGWDLVCVSGCINKKCVPEPAGTDCTTDSVDNGVCEDGICVKFP